MPIRKFISFLIIWFISALFTYKYISEYLPYPAILSFFFLVITASIAWFIYKTNVSLFRKNVVFWGLIILFSVVQIVLFQFIKVEQLHVDRWSIISGFWDFAIQGKYPYYGQSPEGNYPGPMPVYFLLTFPFYRIHEIGYFSLAGIFIFAWFLRKTSTPQNAFLGIFILLSSLAIFWEVVVRSTIITNAVLFLVYLYWLTRSDINKKADFWLTAIAGGLLLSTRNVFVVLFAVYGIFQLKSKLIAFSRLFAWGTVVVITFIITFAPFIIFFPHDFFTMNPFYIQSEYLLPIGFHVGFLILSVVVGFFTRHNNDLVWNTGMVLFAIFISYAIYNSIKHGLTQAYFDSYIDLSYALFCFPFFIFHFIYQKEVNTNSNL